MQPQQALHLLLPPLRQEQAWRRERRPGNGSGMHNSAEIGRTRCGVIWTRGM
jgi:hypothetical protein